MNQATLMVKEGKLMLNEGPTKVTPELAKTLLDKFNYERNRSLAKYHVLELEELMKSDKWIEGHTITFVNMKGQIILVDGQHRLMAVAMQDKPHFFNFSIIPVKNLNEVHEAYCSFDVAIRKRSVSDVLNSANFQEETGLAKTVSRKLVAAAYLAENRLRRVHYTEDVKQRDASYRLEIALKWADVARKYEMALNEADHYLKPKLLSDGIFAVALLTYRWQERIAKQFWEGVTYSGGQSNADPRRTFERDLRNRNLQTNTRSLGEKIAARAWNAFFDRRPLKIIKVYPESGVELRGVGIF